MIRRILLWSMMLLVSAVSRGADLPDQLTFSGNAVEPGGSAVAITVSLASGSRLYTGYEMDIHLPEGLAVAYSGGQPRVAMVKSGGIYPSQYDEDEDTYSYTHMVMSSYGVVGERVLRVACFSSLNENFTSTAGKLLRFYVEADPLMCPGDAEVTIDNVRFVEYAGDVATGYDLSTQHPTIAVGSEAHCPLAVSSSLHWSTAILPFATQIPDGVEAYKCVDRREVGGDDCLILAKQSQMNAFTPYILYSESGYSGTLNGTVEEALYPQSGTVADGMLHGAVRTQRVEQGYVLQNLSEGMKFYLIEPGSAVTIPAGKCWVDATAGAKSLSLSFEGEVNGIGSVATGDGAHNRVYGVDGTTATATSRVLVVNGRKVLR